MIYTYATIHGKINFKGNYVMLYRRPINLKYLSKKDTDIAVSLHGMMTCREVYREPKNSGNPSY